MEKVLTGQQSLVKDFLIALGVSLILGLSAWIAIPFKPVPLVFTAQLSLLAAVIFGKKGAFGVLAYFLEGAMGMPVFSNGNSGLAYLLGPTGGYLVGFVIAAFAISYLVEQIKHKTEAKIFGILLFGNGLIFTFGLPHLALLIGWKSALKFGFYPFIASDVLKLLVGTWGLKRLKFFNS